MNKNAVILVPSGSVGQLPTLPEGNPALLHRSKDLQAKRSRLVET